MDRHWESPRYQKGSEDASRRVAELDLEAKLLAEKREEGGSLSKPSKGDQSSKQSRSKTLSSAEQTKLLGTPDPSTKQMLPTAISFSVVKFGLRCKHISPDLVKVMNLKMKVRFSNLMKVFVGPFLKDFCLQRVKKTFKQFGRIRSIEPLKETMQAYVSIQYETIEAAQLAIDHLNGTEVKGSIIKVQRPISEFSLDQEMVLTELETDSKGVLYMASRGEIPQKETLTDILHSPAELQSVFHPVSTSTGRMKKYCFLRFRTDRAASRALKTLKMQVYKGEQLHCRRAITPPSLYSWAAKVPIIHHLSPLSAEDFEPDITAATVDALKELENVNRNLEELHDGLPRGTLCAVVLPGKESSSMTLPGMAFIGIK